VSGRRQPSRQTAQPTQADNDEDRPTPEGAEGPVPHRQIATIEVEGELNEIIDLFVRINSTGKDLTSQEKRIARFYANPVLKTARALADEMASYFKRHQLLTVGQIHRMKHGDARVSRVGT
jgi:hypothetical protein